MIITYRHLHHNHDHYNQYPTTMNNAAGYPNAWKRAQTVTASPLGV